MRIGCRRLTLKIRFFTVFSVWKTTLVQVKHRISSKIIRNLQIREQIIYDKGLTYRWIAFSRKFDSIKLQTFKFEITKFKVSAQSERSHFLSRNNGCHEKTIRGRFEQQTTLRSQSRAKFKDIRPLAACVCYSDKIVFKISDSRVTTYLYSFGYVISLSRFRLVIGGFISANITILTLFSTENLHRASNSLYRARHNFSINISCYRCLY